jgi:hypothetical protein
VAVEKRFPPWMPNEILNEFLPPLIDGPKLFINLGPKPSKALERERPRIVNNFAKRVSRYE